MANVRCAAFDCFKECIVKNEKIAPFGWSRYEAANFRIPLRTNSIYVLLFVASILFCQFAESIARRQVSVPYERKRQQPSEPCRIKTGTMVLDETSTREPAVKPRDVLSRLEAAVVLRDNLIAALGRVLLVCLDDNARVPFQSIHDAVRLRRVAVYELLRVLPTLRNKSPHRQLYKLLRMVGRVSGSRFISGYASLCVSALPDVQAAVTSSRAPLGDLLRNVDAHVVQSVSRDRHRVGALPLSLAEGIDFLLRAAGNDSRLMNLRTVSAVLLNYPNFDLTDPEVHGAMRFVARRMTERPQDPSLRDAGHWQQADHLLRSVLRRLRADELSAMGQASSLLLRSLGEESYPPAASWKHDLKRLLTMTSDSYPASVAAMARYVVDRLDDSHLRDLDVGFYETTDDHARVQVLARLRRRPDLQHLNGPLSLLRTFVAQKLINDADREYSLPISFYEVNGYLDTFDVPCLSDGTRDAIDTMRAHLSDDLPWSYAFNRQTAANPWQLTLTSLARMRSFPMSRVRAVAIDNFIYKARADISIGEPRGPLYTSGVIFQRDDQMDVEIDLHTLLTHVPNVFSDERFRPLLTFLSKPNVLDMLGHEFNKFDHDTSRDLLLALLKAASTLSLVKSDESLLTAVQTARSSLEEPLLINLYTCTRDLQMLLRRVLHVDSDARYLPLKVLFKQRNLLDHLSPTLSLAGLRTPKQRLSLILRTVSLEVSDPKVIDALTFALETLQGPSRVSSRTLDRDDFAYLLQQLLRETTLATELLTSSAYANVSAWKVSVSGTPEDVLARALSYPADSLASDAKLAGLVKRAEGILREDGAGLSCLKKRTLRALLAALPQDARVKPVTLLLRKAKLLALVPELDVAALEMASERDPRHALTTLLESLSASRVVRAQKSLLDCVEAALSSDERGEAPIQVAYLTRALRDPANVVYQPLLRELTQLGNVTVAPLDDLARLWLRIHLQRIIARDHRDGSLKRAATLALREISTRDEDVSERLVARRAKIEEAASLLPAEPFAQPLERLLTLDWVYGILPEDLSSVDSSSEQQLLLTILRYAEARADIASNPVLRSAIGRTALRLKLTTSVESLKSTVVRVKAAVYEPVSALLTLGRLRSLNVTVPRGRSGARALLELLPRLLASNLGVTVARLLRTVARDLRAFGDTVDLLGVLDDAKIPRTSEFAPIRLLLSDTRLSKRLGRAVLAVAQPHQRYRALLRVLRNMRHRMRDDALVALSSLLRTDLAAIPGGRQSFGNDTRSTSASRLPAVSDGQLRPLRLALRRARQVNVDFMHSILAGGTLDHLDTDNLSNVTDDVDILKRLIDHVLDQGSTDDNAQTHLRSFSEAMALTLGSNYARPIPGLRLADVERMLALIPCTKVFACIRRLLRSGKIFEYVPYYVNVKLLATSADKKLLHLLTLLENSVYGGSARKLRAYLERRLNFISERKLADMRGILASLGSRHDLSALKIFLSRENLMSYLPARLNCYSGNASSTLARVLDNLLLVPSLRRETYLYEAMETVKRSLRKRDHLAVWKRLEKAPSARDLEFVHAFDAFNVSARLREFLSPQRLSSLLPASFTLEKRATFKIKALRLLRHLLQSRTDVDAELQQLHRQVLLHPDVPNITEEDLAPLLNVLASMPHVEFVRSYLKPATLVRLLPGSFDIKGTRNATLTLRNVLSLLNNTAGSDKLRVSLHALSSELDVGSWTATVEARNEIADVWSLVSEIPFHRYEQMARLQVDMTPAKIIAALPSSFQLTEHRTKKLRLLAMLDALSNSDAYRSSLDAIHFARQLVSRMPDVPVVNDAEINRLLLTLPLSVVRVADLARNCQVANLTPYLPIHFNLSRVESRRSKLAEILRYCQLANRGDAAVAANETLPGTDLTRDHLRVLLGAIPCRHFGAIKPLLRFLARTDVSPLLPWSPYEAARTFKLRVLDLLAALRDNKDALRLDDEMLSALEALRMNARSLPDAVTVTPEHVAALTSSRTMSDVKSCAEYGHFVTKTENLVEITPPTYHLPAANSNADDIDAQWSYIMYLSALFLRDVRVDGPVKDAFEACTDARHASDKDRVSRYLNAQLNRLPFSIEAIVPLKLYVLVHADTLAALFDRAHPPRGTVPQYARLLLRQLIRSDSTGSESLTDSLRVFLHDHVIAEARDAPSPHEIDRAIGEIPRDHEFDDVRLLVQCPDVRAPITRTNLSADATAKQLLLDMLRVAGSSELEEETRLNVERLRLRLERAVREDEADHVLKRIRDYRYHVGKLSAIRAYLVRDGLRKILGDGYRARYPSYEDRLMAINGVLVTTAANLSSELLVASNYLNEILGSSRLVPTRTLDDVDVQGLFFALPKTRNETLIRGIVKFFANPKLRKLSLPKDPLEYETKGRLLQAVMSLGMELESVREDTAQREALEYFSDKVLDTDHGVQPIELTNGTRDANVSVDVYGVMRAVNYTAVNVTDVTEVLRFLEREYDLVRAFHQRAYATRGAYLKALLEHLANVSETPDRVKRSMASLVAAVRLDGPGDEAVDLNDVHVTRNGTNTLQEPLGNAAETDPRQTLRQSGQSNMSQKEYLGESFASSLPKKMAGRVKGKSDRSKTSGNIVPRTLDMKYEIIRKARRVKLKTNWEGKSNYHLRDRGVFKAGKRLLEGRSENGEIISRGTGKETANARSENLQSNLEG